MKTVLKVMDAGHLTSPAPDHGTLCNQHHNKYYHHHQLFRATCLKLYYSKQEIRQTYIKSSGVAWVIGGWDRANCNFTALKSCEVPAAPYIPRFLPLSPIFFFAVYHPNFSHYNPTFAVITTFCRPS